MRKFMTKEVTKTIVKVARMTQDVNGMPVAEQLADEVLIGNVSQEKAQKEVNKKYDFPVTVFGVSADTQVFEMAVEDFIKHATLKVDAPAETEVATETPVV